MNAPDSFETQGFMPVPLPAAVEEYRFDRPIDPLEIMLGSVPVMFERAKTSVHRAESYRDFWVVASAFAYDETENRTGIVTSGNFKTKIPDSEKDEYDLESVPKVCAELDVTKTAEQNGFSSVLGIVVAATNDRRKIKDVTGKATTTLHPCDECRSFMGNDPSISNQTFLFTTGFGRSVYQFQTVNSLLTQYNKPPSQYKDPDIYKFNPLVWPIIQQRYRQEMSDRKVNVEEQEFSMRLFERCAKIAKKIIREY